LPPIAILISLVLVWEWQVRAQDVPRTVLAPPSAVIARLVGQPALFIDNAATTILEVALGFVIGTALGIAVAVGITFVPAIGRTIRPLIVTSQVIPTFALAPLLVLWLGFGLEPKVIIIVIGVFFPIVVNLVEGFRSVDPGMVALMDTYRASRWQMLRWVSFPAALPFFFAALQLAAMYSVLGAVFVEWFGAFKGLGKLTLVGQTRRQTDLMLAAVLLITLLAISMFVTVRATGRLAMPWRRVEEEGQPGPAGDKAS
jgi:ABC-type nitrate/sulfonate/bicarbonate transport system permease component